MGFQKLNNEKLCKTFKFNIYFVCKCLICLIFYICDNQYTEIIVDAEHFMHAMILNPEFDATYYNNYKITCYTKNKMYKLITDIGFKRSPQALQKRYRGIRGASRKYYDVFTKP